ncbi:MAG TPA: penicillin-binding protein 1C [Burkholderiales bacterium]|nr:penicillin-binding protein 1C [Burkholderiales bacterium]
MLPRGGFTAFAAFTIFTVSAASAALPSFDQVRFGFQSTEGVLLDRNGQPIQEMRVEERGRRLDWVPLEEVSPAALEAIVRAEDKRFYHHRGVDWIALSDAALDTLFAHPRGASTISMQVAAQLDSALMPKTGRRSVAQKWDQIRAAQALEKGWSKRQILEAYLNLSTFRGELQGIGAAARGLFGKQPSGLTLAESVLLAALLRGPNAVPAAAAHRACAIAAGAHLNVGCGRLIAEARQALGGPPRIEPTLAMASHVARALLSQERRRVRSTLDGAIQQAAIETLSRQLADLEDRAVADGAVLVADNRTGEVLAYVGNAGNRASAFYVDGVRAARQAGSTLKPFLYEMAIEQKLLTAASLTEDSPVNLVTPTGLYVPQNYDHDFKGMVSVRTALSSSLNVPAVRTLMLLGAEPFVERLRALGFEDITGDGDFYGYSLALGSAEVTLWQLVDAYRTLANGGRWSRLTLEPAHFRARKVMDEGAAYIVADILADKLARSPSFGMDNALSARQWAAVKTGTSKDMRDNWCIGFTDRYTVGVWVGNFDGSPMHDVSGVTGAAPIWLELVNFLHRDAASHAPVRPPGIVESPVEFEHEVEAPRSELFLAGTEMRTIAAKQPETTRVSIAYPGNGTIIAVDPDIPAAVQRVRFMMRPETGSYRWRLDGVAIEGDPSATFWRPQTGTHTLALIDSAGREVDNVRFEVRGALADHRSDVGGEPRRAVPPS